MDDGEVEDTFPKLVMSFDASGNEIKDMIMFETTPDSTVTFIDAIAHGKTNDGEILFAYMNLWEQSPWSIPGTEGYIVELDPLNGLIPRGKAIRLESQSNVLNINS